MGAAGGEKEYQEYQVIVTAMTSASLERELHQCFQNHVT